MAAFLAAYTVIRWFVPSWGTVITNAVAGLAVLLDGLNAMSWGTVLPPDKAALVAFAFTGANIVIRCLGAKPAVGSM